MNMVQTQMPQFYLNFNKSLYVQEVYKFSFLNIQSHNGYFKETMTFS